jgi:gluconokinase
MSAPPVSARSVVIVMGVSGSGKSTIGSALAAALGLPFLEADTLHGAHNVAKMRSGQPLTDQDRAPWLAAIGRALADRRRYPRGVLATCSALRHAYRDQLRQAVPGLRFLFLEVSEVVAGQRLHARSGHFMPASLVPSQFATLERPAAGESDVLTVDADADVQTVLSGALRALQS